MSETNSMVMETTSSVLDTTTSSEFGSNLHTSSVTNTGSYNYPSTAASIASSDADYQRDLNNSSLTLPVSRPLSRASTTSCMSVTLFKDGIEGKRIHRSVVPSYPYNLMASMNDNRHLKSPLVQQNSSSPSSEDVSSTLSENGVDSNNIDGTGIDVPSGPPVSLTEKMKLLKTGQVQQNYSMDPNGPSVGPIVFNNDLNDKDDSSVSNNTNESDASMTDYVRFQKQAARDDANE